VGSREVNESVENQISDFLKQHGRTVLGLFLLALVVHDIFGTHGFIAMRRTQLEIRRVRKDIDRLNSVIIRDPQLPPPTDTPPKQ
jgi:hypothetical protein